jgi:hypothetical protein
VQRGDFLFGQIFDIDQSIAGAVQRCDHLVRTPPACLRVSLEKHAGAVRTDARHGEKKLFRGLIFLVLGVALLTIQSICEEEGSVGLSLGDFFDLFQGRSFVQFVTEFVPGLPELRNFRIESRFNSALKLARIRVTICVLDFTQYVASSELEITP